jgi:hypothetical protein
LTEPDTVFRNVIAAPLAGVAVQFLYCSSGSVGEESAAMIGGLIWTVPVPPAPETIAGDAERLEVAGVLLGDVVHLVDARDRERVADLDRAAGDRDRQVLVAVVLVHVHQAAARPAWSRRHVALVGAVHRHVTPAAAVRR